MARLFDHDQASKTKRLFHWDETQDAAFIETVSDVSDLVEENKAQFNQYDERSAWKGDLHRVASIPMNIYYDLQRRGILDDQKALKAWLNSSENKVFRTRPGVV